MKKTNNFTVLQPLMPDHVPKEFDISRHPTLTLKQEKGLKQECTKQENPETECEVVKKEDPKQVIAMPDYC